MNLTLGQQRVGVKDNDPNEVATVKKHIAEIIDCLERKRGDKNTAPANSEKQRLISMAQSDLEKACMLAVKALYAE